MTEDVWKQFEQNPISHSAAHHIMAIAELLAEGGYARVTDVARRLNITRGSASITLKSLKKRGLVEEDDNHFLRLSGVGENVASAIRGKQYLIQTFLETILGVSREQAEIDSCKVEHLISHDAAQKLANFLRYAESDDPRAMAFLEGWNQFRKPCDSDPANCPVCRQECLTHICDTQLELMPKHDSVSERKEPVGENA